jgi:hypothetical protein
MRNGFHVSTSPLQACPGRSLAGLLGRLLPLAILVASVATCGDSTTGPGGQPFDYSHTRSPGTSARDFLSDEDFTRLIIEVDYVGDFQPSQQALDSLEVFLERRLHKPEGIEIFLDESIPSPGQSPYTAAEIRALEQEHRDSYSEEGVLAAYLLVLDGVFEQQNVLGVAYFNTSMAIFGEVIRDNSGGLGQPDTWVIEATSLRHEVGHILGLVNNGTPMVGEPGGPDDHHDAAHGAHCTEEGTLMYWQVETIDFIGNLLGGQVLQLEPLGIQDLQANGGR